MANKKLGMFWYFVAAIAVIVLLISFSPALKARLYIICVLKTQDIPPYDSAVRGFIDELKASGYVENKDYILITLDMKADPEEGKRIIGVIREQQPSLILAVGNEAAEIAKDNITDIPIIYAVVQDPVGNGLIQSYANSGNNLSGASVDISNEQQLRAMRSIEPKVQRVGVIFDPEKSKQKIEAAQKDAESLGIQLVQEPVESYKDVPEAVRSLVSRVDAIWLVPDTTVITRQSLEYIFVRSIWSKKMVIGFDPYIVRSGALFALNFDAYDVGRQSGEIAVKIIKGRRPQDIPSSVPRKTSMVLNLRIAKKLNVDIPETVLRQAKEIVE